MAQKADAQGEITLTADEVVALRNVLSSLTPPPFRTDLTSLFSKLTERNYGNAEVRAPKVALTVRMAEGVVSPAETKRLLVDAIRRIPDVDLDGVGAMMLCLADAG